MCIMHSMKYLIITMAIMLLTIFSGIISLEDTHMFYAMLSLEDAHRFYGVLSLWNVHMQKTVAILIGLSIIAYAILYIYYTCRGTDKPTSR